MKISTTTEVIKKNVFALGRRSFYQIQNRVKQITPISAFAFLMLPALFLKYQGIKAWKTACTFFLTNPDYEMITLYLF